MTLPRNEMPGIITLPRNGRRDNAALSVKWHFVDLYNSDVIISWHDPSAIC